jgi:hypothetical protein
VRTPAVRSVPSCPPSFCSKHLILLYCGARKAISLILQAQDGGSIAKDIAPLFELHVSLSEDCKSLLLSPGESDFISGVDIVLDGFVETCNVVERMLENEDLVCKVVEEEGLEVQTAMKDLILDEEYDEHKSVVTQLLSNAYQNVIDFTGTYNPFRCRPGNMTRHDLGQSKISTCCFLCSFSTCCFLCSFKVYLNALCVEAL